jgi:pimeloyl-ACP methyl ester carboxylesterase
VLVVKEHLMEKAMKRWQKLTSVGLITLTVAAAFAGGKNSRFVTEDGVEIIGSLWMPERQSSPAILLLHMLGQKRQDWDVFAEELVANGYAVVSIDLRGHGQSTKQNDETINYAKFNSDDYQNMVLDVEAVMKYFRNDVRIDSTRIGIVGASIGANVALQAAAADTGISAVVLLSPGRNYRGVATEVAMLDYGKRPVLIAASEEDEYATTSSQYLKELAQGSCRLLLYNNIGHGTRMLGKNTDLEDQIIEWLNTYLQ